MGAMTESDLLSILAEIPFLRECTNTPEPIPFIPLYKYAVEPLFVAENFPTQESTSTVLMCYLLTDQFTVHSDGSQRTSTMLPLSLYAYIRGRCEDPLMVSLFDVRCEEPLEAAARCMAARRRLDLDVRRSVRPAVMRSSLRVLVGNRRLEFQPPAPAQNMSK